MDLLGATCLSAGLIALGIGAFSPAWGAWTIGQWLDRQRQRRAAELQQARIRASPRSYLAISLLAPIVLALIGLTQSPVIAALGAIAGIALPRLYIGYLIRAQVRRSEAEAPKLLQVVLANLTAGSTYLDALRQARAAAQDHWIREDLDYVIQRFLLDVPLDVGIREIRTRVRSRNLGLIWDNLAVCCANRVPTQTAKVLLMELSGTVQFNVQVANEVLARAAGQRLQIWLLALIVPTMYLYLRLVSPDLLSFLDETFIGRYVLFPTAAVLEVLGLYLSVRVSRFQA